MEPPDPPLTPELLVHAYTLGAFPMANPRRGGRIDWYSPNPRAIIPLDGQGFTVRRSLQKVVRGGRFELKADSDFASVIRACAEPRDDDEMTWINRSIIEAYEGLHASGLAHSVEAWRDGQLCGGLYGVSLGGAFFGESMFSRESYASQVCLVWLVERLRRHAFTLLDVQFVNPHLTQFGVMEVPRDEYLRQLEGALAYDCTF